MQPERTCNRKEHILHGKAIKFWKCEEAEIYKPECHQRYFPKFQDPVPLIKAVEVGRLVGGIALSVHTETTITKDAS